MRFFSPLEQFEVHPIIQFGIGLFDFTYTNVALYLTLIFILFVSLSALSRNERKLIPHRWQSILEMAYDFIRGLVKEQVGDKGATYFPFVFTLFFFILFANLIGMVPYSYTVTAQIVVSFGLSVMIFIGVTILGFLYHGLGFFRIFLPSGTALWLAPLLIVVEILSYLARCLSLAVRLSANMLAGHALLHIIAGFIWKMVLVGGILALLGFAPLALLGALIGLELGIAILQAYVFTVLMCSYINDSIHLH